MICFSLFLGERDSVKISIISLKYFYHTVKSSYNSVVSKVLTRGRHPIAHLWWCNMVTMGDFSSLDRGRSSNNFKSVNFQFYLLIDILGTCYKILSGEYHRTPLMTRNIASANGLVLSGNNSLPDIIIVWWPVDLPKKLMTIYYNFKCRPLHFYRYTLIHRFHGSIAGFPKAMRHFFHITQNQHGSVDEENVIVGTPGFPVLVAIYQGYFIGIVDGMPCCLITPSQYRI